jgi:hypothetical protein
MVMSAHRRRLLTEQSERERFADLRCWQRTRKGNLWRLYEGVTLTIFERSDGWYGWCCADGDGPEFSPHGFESEAEAIDDLADALGIGEID